MEHDLSSRGRTSRYIRPLFAPSWERDICTSDIVTDQRSTFAMAERRTRHAPSGATCILTVSAILVGCVAGCQSMAVGPDFEKPEAEVAEAWSETEAEVIKAEPADHSDWWTIFNDPTLDQLIELAYQQNLSLQIAGLKVVESRAQVGIAGGNLYPQLQQLTADYDYHAAPSSAGGSFGSASFGFDTSWELDLWGKYRRGVESADASLFASIASYDDVVVTLTAEVARTYVLIRSLEERIRVANENIKVQSRALEITNTLFNAGTQSELDMQQAATTLYNTQSLIPSLRISLRQAQHSLSILLGLPPEDLSGLLGAGSAIPSAPATVAVGVPADLLRRRPDIRQAEFLAAAQSARIGIAKSELYPSLSLVGTLGWSATDAAGGSLGDVLKAQSFGADIGPSVRWNILNYGRIKNQVRAQDAVFQQTLANNQNVVLGAAREVEDSMVGFLQSQEQAGFLGKSVESSKRALDLAMLQYKEGIVDYQRVLDSTRALTQQQDQYIATVGNITVNLVGMYKALGGGWQIREGKPVVRDHVSEQMEARTDWGEILTVENEDFPDQADGPQWRKPDW